MNKNQNGFTLLEAIIALVLISVTGIALLNWVNTNLLTLRQVQKIQQRQLATRNALEFIETVDLEDRKYGEEIVGIYTFKWETRTVEELKNGSGFFLMALYDVQIEVLTEQELLASFNIRQVAFKSIELPDYYF
ncbi:MAG: prepilin-type N-terminal cleavage/methylation domain-containing protein [Thiomargarita sp.]|nr:prepilin-type N-terminal cleavage/methylation domain-containing protein [Thiomargarita sp.]